MFQLPFWWFSLSWRGAEGFRKALVGDVVLVHPWTDRHVPLLPKGFKYIFVQPGTTTHQAFLPLLLFEPWGFRKTERPLKILGAQAAAFPALLPPCAWGHWGKRKQAALVVREFPAGHYKELPAVNLLSQSYSEPEESGLVSDCWPDTEPTVWRCSSEP